MWLLWAQSENKIIGFASLAASLFSSCFYKNISRRTPATVQTHASLQSLPLLPANRGGVSRTHEYSAVTGVAGASSQVALLWACLDGGRNARQQTHSGSRWQLYGWCATHSDWCLVFLPPPGWSDAWEQRGKSHHPVFVLLFFFVIKWNPNVLLHSIQMHSKKLEKIVQNSRIPSSSCD